MCLNGWCDERAECVSLSCQYITSPSASPLKYLPVVTHGYWAPYSPRLNYKGLGGGLHQNKRHARPPACGHTLMSMNRPPAYGLNSNVITWMAARLLWQPSTDWWTRTDATLARQMIHKYQDNGETPSPSAGMADLSDAGNSWVGTTARTGGPMKHLLPQLWLVCLRSQCII